MRSFRPSPAIQEIAAQIASGMPKRNLGGIAGAASREVPMSAKNRRIVDLATAFDARRRQAANPDLYPNNVTRQQKRWLRRAGPSQLGVLAGSG